MAPAAIAPLLPVPEREVVALEHPMIIQNLENGLRTIGTPADQVSDCKVSQHIMANSVS